MPFDKITGKAVDKPSDLLPKTSVDKCDIHGCSLTVRCLSCGAPLCCPMCCDEMENLHKNRLRHPW
jgi:hypothetical protein